MNTQARLHRLEAGQALPQVRRGAGPVVLAEGEVLVQEPARWLGGTVVVAPAVRLVAPAVLPSADGCSVVAVHASSVLVPEAQPVLALRALRAASAWLRGGAALEPAGRG